MSVPIVVYCRTCDYFLKTAVSGSIGTHGCVACNHLMEVYVAQEYARPDYTHSQNPARVASLREGTVTG